MEITKTHIEGVLVLKPQIFKDYRGSFCESFSARTLKDAGIELEYPQDNQAVSHKNVVRGLHFQHPPYAQAKIVRVVHGSTTDVVLDLRKHSKTYGQYFSIELSFDNGLQLYIPEGFAHGYAAHEDNTVVAYKCSRLYERAAEGVIRYDDPDLHIDWHVDQPIVSEKDVTEAAFLKDFVSRYE